MLSGLHTQVPLSACRDDRYDRDREEDMKLAISMVFAFKRELDALHPDCVRIIEKLLHNPNADNHW